MKSNFVFACILCVYSFAAMLFADDVKDSDFVQLIPSKAVSNNQIDGWIGYGGNGMFKVEGKEIVGKSGDSIVHTFLRTEKKYKNFVLKFDVKYDVECNAGVLFRSYIDPNGQFESIAGYKCVIEPSKNAANVWDEHRRNRFLTESTPELQAKIDKAFKKGDWNEIIIQCVGPSIKTWLNGEKVTDFFDIESNEGVFALQVPSAKSGASGQVRWRNIRVLELPATEWVALYADKKFGEVETKPVGKWEILEDGSLKGTTEKGQPKDGMFLSKNSYKNFVVKVSFKIISGNSGLYFRAAEVDKPHWMKGFQCEIASGKSGDTAGLWEVDGRGWVKRNMELTRKLIKVGDWNEVGTVAIDDRLVTFLNGQIVVDVLDPKSPKEGKTGLQLHGGGSQGCLFREYYIMPLDDKAVELIKK
ncbi:MAG: DUF1080 domain-containing protein [Planctomycetaceae bacterium]|nr:DUF1080 domain-containing protein [Planctomycetaceae bacterium]